MTSFLGLFSLILFALVHVDALKCKAGTPTLGKLTEPNLPDTDCIGSSGLEDLCYVMFTDYDNDNIDAWTYGCLIKGSLNKCDKSFRTEGVTNNYCCCTTPLCNDKSFAEKCGESSKNDNGNHLIKSYFLFTLISLFFSFFVIKHVF